MNERCRSVLSRLSAPRPAGPGLLSLLTATLFLGAGVAVIGGLALAAAVQLGYWIPRVGRRRVSP